MSANHKDVGSSPADDQKFFVQVFWLCETFFHKFFKCLQRVPPSFFFYFANKWIFNNSQRPHFYIFRHHATYRRPKKNFEKKLERKFRKKIEKKIQEKFYFFKFFPLAGTVEKNT